MAFSHLFQLILILCMTTSHFVASELVGASPQPGSLSQSNLGVKEDRGISQQRALFDSTENRQCCLAMEPQTLMRLRGGSAVSEQRLKAQAQALAAVKAKARQMAGKTAADPKSNSVKSPPAAAPSSAPAAPTSAPAAAPARPAPVAAPKVENNQAAARKSEQPPTAATSTVSPSDFAAVPKPREPMPVVEPPADTMEIPGGEDPVQPITGAGSVKKVTDIAQKNRLLVMQCKALRARATDPKMKQKLDARIFELEAAWQNYVKVDTSTTQHSLFAPKPVMIQRSPSQLELDDRMQMARRTRIPVTFTVRCPLTAVGERVLLLGDIEELGSWNPLAAVPLDTTNSTYPLWHGTVDMPAGAIVEYKYAIGTPGIFREQFDIVEWEGYMGNRGFKVPRKAHHIHEDYVEGVNHGQEIDYDVPEYLTMHRIGGSECFLDPEYASIY